jgi:hypothetical protein
MQLVIVGREFRANGAHEKSKVLHDSFKFKELVNELQEAALVSVVNS